MNRIVTETTMRSTQDVATKWGVKVDRVLDFIKSGELRAINLAVTKTRPRWKIPLEEIERFELSRMSKPPIPRQMRRRKPVAPVREFF